MEDKTLTSKTNAKLKTSKVTTLRGHKKAEKKQKKLMWKRFELKDNKSVSLLSGSPYSDTSLLLGVTVQVSDWVMVDSGRKVRREMYYDQKETAKNGKWVQDLWFVEMNDEEMEKEKLKVGNFTKKKDQEKKVMSEDANVGTVESGNEYSMQELHRKSGVSVLTLRKYMKRFSAEIPHSVNAKGHFSFNDASVEAVRAIKERNTASS